MSADEVRVPDIMLIGLLETLVVVLNMVQVMMSLMLAMGYRCGSASGDEDGNIIMVALVVMKMAISLC